MAKYKASDVGTDTCKTTKTSPCGGYEKWIPARPENYKFDSISSRIKQAWGVLTGKYDALDWEND